MEDRRYKVSVMEDLFEHMDFGHRYAKGNYTTESESENELANESDGRSEYISETNSDSGNDSFAGEPADNREKPASGTLTPSKRVDNDKTLDLRKEDTTPTNKTEKMESTKEALTCVRKTKNLKSKSTF